MQCDTAPILLVSPDMRSSVMGVARSLTKAGLLKRFVTTLALNQASVRLGPAQLVERKLRRLLRTRIAPAYLTVPIETVPLGELARIAASRMGLSDVMGTHVWEWSEARFDRKVADKWAGKVQCIYGCENSSVETFVRHKAAGGHTILWQVIAHHQTMNRLIEEEYEAFPDAITPYLRHLFKIKDRVNERKDRQWANSDLIIANSFFSRQTFIDAGFPAEKVIGIPTGCPPVEVSTPKRASKDSPFIFLCAGNQSIRKGIPYLLNAWRKMQPLPNAELWLVGGTELPPRLLEGLPANVVIRPSVPKAELKGLFDRASILVLPTLCEGLAHIILEAMSFGLGIITTENSGCGDLVENGVNGWKVAIRSADELADKMTWCIENRDALPDMSQNSLIKAQNWQEEDFARVHLDTVAKFLVEKGIVEKGSIGTTANA